VDCIAGPTGEVLAQVGSQELKNGNLHPDPEKVEGFVVQEFDLDQCRVNRAGWVSEPRIVSAVAWLKTVPGADVNVHPSIYETAES
jgi:hypothetical protein